ncbi:membrane-spanning 4-domains subfamily A member 18 [Lepus europaeus]|uniref:membrane-spanning 4-domains subfamily A member 18 n=1 Tax=Lepus europaeus TaxID=9983 RepID=UPI002B4A2518|nr:membrane-spanning 4-domains subfamily A member 18 [Lepus europaeus]
MTEQGSGAISVPGIVAPGNAYVTHPRYTVASESLEQTSRVAAYPVPSKVTQCDPGRANLQNPLMESQKPAGMPNTQNQAPGLQHPGTTANVQTPSGVIQYSAGPTGIQTLSGAPPNPPNAIPGPVYTPNQPQWTMSFEAFSAFNPKKFINDESKTLGAAQIFIGLMHIVYGITPLLYDQVSVLGLSAYLFWGGIMFVVSGSISVWAEKSHNTCAVNGSIIVNIMSAIFSLLGIFILIADLAVLPPPPNNLQRYVKPISACLLPFALLELILTCMISHFGCQAVCCKNVESTSMLSTMFGINTTNTATGPVNTTTGPVNSVVIPVNTATGPVSTTNGPVGTTTSPVNSVVIPVNSATGPVHTATSPANISTTIPAYATYSEPSYQEVADVTQR